ncbi:hypothetical protein [Streptomyces avermitilis]|uniref:hypothetical protein n=1 Tax=Streptomyces avermitilis TaxID=33903 RepID=UPI0033A1C684
MAGSVTAAAAHNDPFEDPDSFVNFVRGPSHDPPGAHRRFTRRGSKSHQSRKVWQRAKDAVGSGMVGTPHSRPKRLAFAAEPTIRYSQNPYATDAICGGISHGEAGPERGLIGNGCPTRRSGTLFVAV